MLECVLNSDKVSVFDDVLPDDAFRQIWEAVQREYFSVNQTAVDFSLYWRHGDVLAASSALCGDHSNDGNNGYRDVFKAACLELAGRMGLSPTGFQSSAQLYGRGTKLSWHRDHGGGGVFTYYVHQEWKPTWGGELFVPEQTVKPEEDLGRRLVYGGAMNDDLKTGMGFWITPKPNRIVYTAPNVLHQVNRVDPDAGDALRVTLIGRLTV